VTVSLVVIQDLDKAALERLELIERLDAELRGVRRLKDNASLSPKPAFFDTFKICVGDILVPDARFVSERLEPTG
jgi:hypothetical protein